VDGQLDVTKFVLACFLLELAVLAMNSLRGQLIALTLYNRILVFWGVIFGMGPFPANWNHFLTHFVTTKPFAATGWTKSSVTLQCGQSHRVLVGRRHPGRNLPLEKRRTVD